jgi:hypothetical protein
MRALGNELIGGGGAEFGVQVGCEFLAGSPVDEGIGIGEDTLLKMSSKSTIHNVGAC